MLPDLFSQFDPSVSAVFKGSPLGFWAGCYILIFPLSASYYVQSSRAKVLLALFVSPIVAMSKDNKSKKIQGVTNFLTGLFLLLFSVNFTGLMPWTFSGSSQFLLTLTMAVPAWLATVLVGTSAAPAMKLGEYVGTSIPVMLGPPIGLCEIGSAAIRPVTLGLRLAANMVAGHIITSLVLSTLVYVFKSGGVGVFFMLFMSTGLYMFEMAICFIQAYVFVLLLGIYVQECPMRE